MWGCSSKLDTANIMEKKHWLEVTPTQMLKICIGLEITPTRFDWDDVCFITIQSENSPTAGNRLTLHMGVMCNSQLYEEYATKEGIAQPVTVVSTPTSPRNDGNPA
jgi:hypothetical protein